MCTLAMISRNALSLAILEARIYLPEKDGMTLGSFWEQDGQKVINGSFYPQERFNKMSSQRSPEYVKAMWKNGKTDRKRRTFLTLIIGLLTLGGLVRFLVHDLNEKYPTDI